MTFLDPLWQAMPVVETALFIAFGLSFVAGVVRGFSGFGTALVLSAPMAVLYGPAIAVPILTFIDPVASIKLWRPASKICNWRVVLILVLGTGIGSPIGVYVLSIADPEMLTKAIAVMLLVSVAILASGWRYRKEPGAGITAATGLTAGVAGGVSGLAGVPVMVFLMGGKSTPQVMRANIIMFFALGSLVTVGGFIWRDLLTWEVFALALTMIPFYYVGVVIGSMGFGRLGADIYRHVVLGMVGAIGVITLLL
ncbi:MAG: sulfite exporter TauE/SafE family protein [Alphaproteobacteria bacterium]|nr:sulfite exporter TauE/SafE family protein [Alphaproteobacteria bacterium]